jgi:hypothetical protein
MRREGDNLKLEFHHFPLVQIHANALPASKAAEAAGDQGYWEMNDLLFVNQSRFSGADWRPNSRRTPSSASTLTGSCSLIGLLVEGASYKMPARLRSAVDGTPTFSSMGENLGTSSGRRRVSEDHQSP